MSPTQFLPGLGLALVIGLLLGIERGWRMRDEREGARVAGVRTFALLGLFGGLIGLQMGGPLQWLALALGIAAALTLVAGYRADIGIDGNVSATSALAGIVTLGLGALAGHGQMAIASVGAGVSVILLASRESLHRALVQTSEAEIRALVRLVLVVFVIFPLLPDAPFGPYGLNPRRLWAVVVITGAISLAGYVLIRLFGGRRGALITALVGALVSSTAVTLDSARRMRGGEAVATNGAAIAVASTVMLLRSWLLIALLAPYVLAPYLALLVPALVLSAAASALLFWRSGKQTEAIAATAVSPPDLKLAILFGGLVLLISTAAGWAEQQVHGGGAAVVAIGGLFDVDSAIAALGTLPPGTLPPSLAAVALAVPVIFNSVLKLAMALAIAGARRAWPAALALGLPAVLMAALGARALLEGGWLP